MLTLWARRSMIGDAVVVQLIPFTKNSTRLRIAGRLVVSGAVTAGSVAALPSLLEWQRGRLAEELGRRAAASPVHSVASVREMWPLGLPATRPLVELAAAQRPELAQVAQDAVSNQLAAWEVELASGGEAELFAERLQVLSESLRANAGRFDWSGQLWSKKVARMVSHHAGKLEGPAAFQVLTACEAVLSTPETARPALSVVADAAPASDSTTPTVAPEVDATPLSTVASQVARQRVDAPPALPSELSVIMPPTDPPRMVQVNPDNPLREIAEPVENAGDATPNKLTAAPNPTTSAPGEGTDVPSPLEMRHDQQRLRELSDNDLMTFVDSASRFEAAAAREVLRTRGYTGQLLELTRQLRSMPAEARRQALERAAALPAADARRLLRWFVADADAEVRLHALRMLATTGDPQLREIARQRAIEDADPRVSALATQLMNAR